MKTNIKTRKKKGIHGFQVLENECVWMKAGVVNFRICDNNYDCRNCAFDKAMMLAVSHGREPASNRFPLESDLRKRYRPGERPCRHFLTGRIEEPKKCNLNYECYHCAFDQMLADVDLHHLTVTPSYSLASGYKLADECYYGMGHAWARFEHGGNVRIGFDDFIARLFGVMQTVSLPSLGTRLEQNDIAWAFSRQGQSAGALSPVSGPVLAVNHKAMEHPEIILEDSYHEGWLFVVEPETPKKSVKSLFFGKESVRWTERESAKLMGLLGTRYQNLAATGGEPIRDVYGHFPELGWGTLVKNFLQTEIR